MTEPPSRPSPPPYRQPVGHPPAPTGYEPPAPPLDRLVAESLATRPAWPARATWGPLAFLVGLIVVAGVLGRLVLTRGSDAGLVLSAIAEVVLLAGIVMLARPIVRTEGSWSAAFGLRRLLAADWLPWLAGVGIALAARFALGVVAVAASHGRAIREASNLSLDHVTPATVTVLAIVAVVLAPITEELIFRGILLRGLMRRLSFWPAAMISTVLFAGLHAYEVHTLVGAATLVTQVAVVGLVNCCLVRATGRLTPGIMLHATSNALGVLVLVLRNG